MRKRTITVTREVEVNTWQDVSFEIDVWDVLSELSDEDLLDACADRGIETPEPYAPFQEEPAVQIETEDLDFLIKLLYDQPIGSQGYFILEKLNHFRFVG